MTKHWKLRSGKFMIIDCGLENAVSKGSYRICTISKTPRAGVEEKVEVNGGPFKEVEFCINSTQRPL
ncbi:hypothetical protein OSTOST_09164 [Ostertagia ostertagi]